MEYCCMLETMLIASCYPGVALTTYRLSKHRRTLFTVQNQFLIFLRLNTLSTTLCAMSSCVTVEDVLRQVLCVYYDKSENVCKHW